MVVLPGCRQLVSHYDQFGTGIQGQSGESEVHNRKSHSPQPYHAHLRQLPEGPDDSRYGLAEGRGDGGGGGPSSDCRGEHLDEERPGAGDAGEQAVAGAGLQHGLVGAGRDRDRRVGAQVRRRVVAEGLEACWQSNCKRSPVWRVWVPKWGYS